MISKAGGIQRGLGYQPKTITSDRGKGGDLRTYTRQHLPIIDKRGLFYTRTENFKEFKEKHSLPPLNNRQVHQIYNEYTQTKGKINNLNLVQLNNFVSNNESVHSQDGESIHLSKSKRKKEEVVDSSRQTRASKLSSKRDPKKIEANLDEIFAKGPNPPAEKPNIFDLKQDLDALENTNKQQRERNHKFLTEVDHITKGESHAHIVQALLKYIFDEPGGH